jgi:hypothetical protein
MKIEANGLLRGAAFVFEVAVIQTTISQMILTQTTGGDGLNVRPND